MGPDIISFLTAMQIFGAFVLVAALLYAGIRVLEHLNKIWLNTVSNRLCVSGRQDDVDDARVTKSETLVRRGKKWFRYDAPDKRLFKQLQKTLVAAPD
jgi:hypothetical protein